jgi:hypothetical protein
MGKSLLLLPLTIQPSGDWVLKEVSNSKLSLQDKNQRSNLVAGVRMGSTLQLVPETRQ